MFINIETELTTAVTDLVLGLLSLASALGLLSRRKSFRPSGKAESWAAAFLSLSLAGFLGFWAHGFMMEESFRDLLWQPLYFSLGLTVALFLAGVLIDLSGKSLPTWLYLLLVLVAGLFYGITLVVPGSFLVFIAYEGVVMLFALGAYIRKALTDARPAWRWMTAGIALSIAAAVVQATGSLSLRLIWELDHNGIFHLIQMAGVAALMRGLFLSIPGEPKGKVQQGQEGKSA